MKHDDLYIDITYTVSSYSRCRRQKVGAVIVKDNNIISFGWNGTPPGFDNVCECEGGFATKDEVIHAEQNALAKAARSTISTEGATLYLTLSPCWNCAKSIIQSGIKRVVYVTKYRDDRPIQFLADAGVAVEQKNDEGMDK